MKTCPKCNINKVKNSYEMCFTCHNNKEESSSEIDKDQPVKRESIPKTVRNALWINYFKEDSRTGKCQCCLREIISISNFNCGHIVAHANGGKTTLDNLVPICTLCNTSMSTYNLKDFIKKYNLHYEGTLWTSPIKGGLKIETDSEDSDD
jgi:hypothetical protein